MKAVYLSLLICLASCENWHGSPVPLGDEFEGHWTLLDSLQERVTDMCASNSDPDCIYAMSPSRIWQVKDTLVLITAMNEELTCLAASFLLPERLLCGTASPALILINASGDTSRIAVPEVSHISHVAFDPVYASGFYAGDDNLILKRDSAGSDLDTILYSPDDIIEFIVLNSGAIYAATQWSVFRSTDRGTTWDTISAPTGDPISQITIDRQENLYAYCGSTIYRTADKVTWTSFYADSIAWELTAGTADGLIIVGGIEVRKIINPDRWHDISHGIIMETGYSPRLLSANERKYILAFSHLDAEITMFFCLKDSPLPP
jgi:hypothetical protein